MKTAVKFDTTPWTRSHTAAPRGFGSWAFQVDGSDEVVFTRAMTFTDARKWMTARVRDDSAFRNLAVVFVNVLP